MNSEQKWQKAREILNNKPSETELQEAVRLVKEAVDENHAGAYFTLATLYNMGNGVEKDKKKAYQLYRKSFDLGYERAKLALAIRYVEGEVVEQDLGTAEEYIRELAEKDDVDACAYLAQYLLDDVFPHTDNNEGITWLRKAAEMGHPMAMARLGEICGNMCEDEEAIAWFNKAKEAGVNGVEEAMKQYTLETYHQRRVEYIRYCISVKEYSNVTNLIERDATNGDDAALHLIAYFCIYGMGDEQYGQDVEKGMKLYEDFSAKGDPDADYHLGRVYEQYPEKKDIDKAFQYYMKSAEGGNAAGQYSVGRFYNDGIIGPIDKEKAQKWMEAAGAQNHRDALLTMAFSYIQDPDVMTLRASNLNYEKNAEKGIELLIRAAQLGQPEAFYVLAICHQNGKYVEQDDKKAFGCLRNSIQAGTMLDNVRLMGDFYRDGIGTEQNFEAAAYHYQWCADNGDVNAMFSLSQLYEEGKGVEKDSEKAAELRKRCWEINNWTMFGTLPLDVAKEQAKQGDPEAMCQLGNRYQKGDEVEQNIDVASDWWLKAAMKNHSLACHNLGAYYLSEKHDIEAALKWLSKSAEQNYTLSYNLLGDIYINGWGIDPNVEKGIEYLVKSMELGDKDAPLKLAALYHDGNQIERDTDKAKLYLEKYLEYDSADAHYRMGQCLLNGDMYDKDYNKALEHLRIAVKGRCYDAASMYIDLLWDDNGVGKNQQEVIDTFTELANDYDGTAWYYLYQLYNNQENDHRDAAKALECLKKSAEIGCGDAFTTMGLMYQNGDLLPKDDVKAFECFDKAASQGNIVGFVNAALCYRNGRGIDKDVQRSLEMFIAAADHGDAFAAREAAIMLFYGQDGIAEDDDRAVAVLEKHADSDMESCYMLAYILLVQADNVDCYSWTKVSRAAQLMKKAADAGHPDALYHLAGLYMEGRGVIVDEGKAKELYEQCISNGINVEESKKAIEQNLTGENAGNNKFYYWQTLVQNNKSRLPEGIFCDDDDYTDIAKLTEAAALCGECNALMVCGTLKLQNDPDKAEECFTKVIESGRPDLALDLGRMYFFGNGVEEDVKRAASYFQKGVDQGDYECMMFLAMIYKALDDEEALDYAKQLYGAVYSGSPEDSDLEKRSAYHYGEILYNELQNGKSMDDYEVSELMCLMKYCSPVGLVKTAADALVKMAEKVDSVEILKMVPVFYTMAGESQTAFEVIDYYLSQLPEDDFIITQRADCHALLCHDEEALRDYKVDALLQENLESSRANYANILLKQNRFDDVVNFVNKAIESGFNDCELLVYRGKAYEALGKHELAVKDFTEASTRSVDGDSELMPAFALLLLGKYDECKDCLESGLETLEDGLDYTMCYAYNNAAYYYSLMGDNEKAIDYCIKSFETGYLLFDYMKAYKPELMQIPEIQSYVKEHTSK